ncbi:hypothetical protein [Staphylococcus equorum]|uniref:hypothetical protein n=1 Tax=Staphylococcus equorum TaxID=246432 RepID=UPI00192D0C39|nr:hypothetical protein [Staphylococcus equorum]
MGKKVKLVGFLIAAVVKLPIAVFGEYYVNRYYDSKRRRKAFKIAFKENLVGFKVIVDVILSGLHNK